ncbi:MAG: BBE domain-containing protein, partial [Solirubrobacterales bacterium]|nr:BBE domain-containing protein [Solirubrobacterales bacterium]
MHAWSSGRVYPAFPDPELPDWENAYYGDQRQWLQEIKAIYDP